MARFPDSSVSLRPSGIGRYFLATFLIVWLAGWALGEAFALGFLILLIRSVVGAAVGVSWPIPAGDWIIGGAAGFFLLFLLVWLTLWTVGGVLAIIKLVRSLAGEDRVSVLPASVDLMRRAGPFRRVRRFDRSLIRRVRLRHHDQAVVLDTASGSELITSYGTSDERQAMTLWLRQRLSLPDEATPVDTSAAPPGWRMTIEGGTARLCRSDRQARRVGALISWVIAGLMGLIWFGSTRSGPAAGSMLALSLTLLLAAWATWATWSRREWLVRRGQLTWDTRFLTWQRERSFRSARLEVVISTDSDNDDHYELKVFDEQGKRTIASEVNDEAGIVDLARWLAARTGFPLTLPRGLQAKAHR
jgi:hypothetical protein